jgi:hypothetical protein
MCVMQCLLLHVCCHRSQVSPVYHVPLQLSANQLLQLLHYQQVLHNLLNWSSKVRGMCCGAC